MASRGRPIPITITVTIAVAVGAAVVNLLGGGPTGVSSTITNTRSHVVVQSSDENAPFAFATSGRREGEHVGWP